MAKLLIADEDPSLVKPVAEYFRKQGHTVECLADGPEALKHVLATPPDVLLMDTFLTSLDVFQLLGHVYETLPDVAIRTVVMTAIGAVGEPIHDWSMPVHAQGDSVLGGQAHEFQDAEWISLGLIRSRGDGATSQTTQ